MRPIDYGSGLMEAQAQLASMENSTVLSLRQNLQVRLANAEREIARVNELLQLLDRNPDIQRILELLGR
jgi:hypothetical protein